MGIVASDRGGTDFKPVPAGTHIGICVLVADLGIQGGGKFKPSQKVYLRWELPNEVTEWTDRDGNKKSGPMIIGREYTLSLSEKANLRADLESWRGRLFTEQELKGFDIVNVLGKACMLGVVHNEKGGKVYANVASVMGLPKGTTVPGPHNKPTWYSPAEHDAGVYESLPEWIRDKIANRIRDDVAPTTNGSSTGGDDYNDDIPF